MKRDSISKLAMKPRWLDCRISFAKVNESFKIYSFVASGCSIGRRYFAILYPVVFSDEIIGLNLGIPFSSFLCIFALP